MLCRVLLAQGGRRASCDKQPIATHHVFRKDNLVKHQHADTGREECSFRPVPVGACPCRLKSGFLSIALLKIERSRTAVNGDKFQDN